MANIENENYNLEGISFEAPEGSTQVQSRSGRYKPEVCKRVLPNGEDQFFPVQGLVNSAIFRPSKDPKMKNFYDLEIRLTKPTYACAGKDDVLERFEKDDTILITATASLQQWVEVAKRENPESIPEIFLIPVGKKDLGGRQTMWEYKVNIVGHHDPKTVSSLSSLLAEKHGPQITAGAPVVAS